MKINIVNNQADWRLFHSVAHRVYRDDPNWISPLEPDVENTFSPQHNVLLRQGEARCFVLLDEANQPAGRIAAFIDPTQNEARDHSLGGIGFFECVQNPDYAQMLFRVAEDYLAERGITVVEGPVNFGQRDRFWGLLVKGWAPPLFQENYHPPYYREFFEQAGYRPFEQVLTFKGRVDELPIDRFRNLADKVKNKYPVHAETLKMKQADKYVRDLSFVYNKAFRSFPHFREITVKEMGILFNQLKPIIDPDLIAIAYYEGVPAGACVLLPDIATFLRFAKGRLSWWKLPVFFLHFKTARQRRLKGILFGIDPEHHRKGLYSVLVDKLHTPRVIRRYPKYYLAGIRAHNGIMVKTTLALGVKVDRVHLTMRKNLVDDIPFEPFPFLELQES